VSSSQTGASWIEAVNAKVKSKRTIGYFRANASSELYEYILKKFLEYQKRTKITKAQFAESIQKDAGQLNRLLAGPGNWTIETVSDLLLGMGERIKPVSEPIVGSMNANKEDTQTDVIASAPAKHSFEQRQGIAAQSDAYTASNDDIYPIQTNRYLAGQGYRRNLMA
jgi:hypothetical protein